MPTEFGTVPKFSMCQQHYTDHTTLQPTTTTFSSASPIPHPFTTVTSLLLGLLLLLLAEQLSS